LTDKISAGGGEGYRGQNFPKEKKLSGGSKG